MRVGWDTESANRIKLLEPASHSRLQMAAFMQQDCRPIRRSGTTLYRCLQNSGRVQISAVLHRRLPCEVRPDALVISNANNLNSHDVVLVYFLGFILISSLHTLIFIPCFEIQSTSILI